MYSILAWSFPICYYLSFALSKSMCMFTLEILSSSFNSFFMLSINSASLLCYFPLYTFRQNCFVCFADGCSFLFVRFLLIWRFNFLSLFWNVFSVSFLTMSVYFLGFLFRSIFKQSLTSLNSDFSFSKTSFFTKAEEPSLPFYLPIAEGRIIGFKPFPRVLVLCEISSFLMNCHICLSLSFVGFLFCLCFIFQSFAF